MAKLESTVAVAIPEKEIHHLRNELIQITCKLMLSARIISRLALCPGDNVLAAVIIADGAANQPATIPAGVELQEEYEIRLNPPNRPR